MSHSLPSAASPQAQSVHALPAGLPPLTPAMQAVLSGMERVGNPPMHTTTVAQARAFYAAGAQALELPKPALARVDNLHVMACDGAQLPVRLYSDAPLDSAALQPAVLYLHGGGFTIGSIETHDVLCRRMAKLSGAAVVSLDYRLAPEHRFPTAFNDVQDTLQWLAQHGDQWQIDASRLAVAGDSAGGTLAAAAAIAARESGLALKAQVLIYPGTTAHQDTASHHRFAAGPVLTEPLISWFFAHYIDRAQRTDWRFAPLLADDLEGLAPALFILAECDALVDEGLAYADSLRLAGVPVDLELFKGVTHEFIKMGRAIPEALAAHEAIAAFLKFYL